MPYHRLNGRIILIRSELEAWLAGLPGVTLSEARANMAERNGEG
jgi:hypothetical protein